MLDTSPAEAQRLLQPRDPCLHQELLFERRRDRLGLEIWRRNGGHPESRPPERSEAERLEAARQTLACQAAAEAEPAARFRRLLNEIEARLAEVPPLLFAARAAADRGFETERELCADRARGLHRLARALRDLTLEAVTLAEGQA